MDHPLSPEEQRQQRALQVIALERTSTILVDAGVSLIKRNPIPSGMYFIGILICLFFSGWTPNTQQTLRYEQTLDSLDPMKLDEAEAKWYRADMRYRQTKGWFTCDQSCQKNRIVAQNARVIYDQTLKEHEDVVREAKSQLGLFSTFGVTETRDLFWKRFAQGRGFAQRQSKWDALFMGISAMARDESILSYFLRVVMNVALNFTIGVFGAVVAFLWGLWGVIHSYRADILSAFAFFSFAAMAAIAFAMTWIVGLYAAAAGSAYVGCKVLAANLRVENGYTGGERRRHIN